MTTDPTPPNSLLTVALVDDEADLRESVAIALSSENLRVEQFDDGDVAAQAFNQQLPDLAVLDIMLPGIDGLELCRRLRAQSETLPILFLTSRDEEFDRVLGLELGADDYLCKPFSLRELVARVRVLVRRLRLLQSAPVGPKDSNHLAAPESKGVVSTEIITSGPLALDLLRYQASWSGYELALTITEFRLLHALARRPGHVRSRQQLIEDAYPEDHYKSSRTIDTHIKRLRKKIQRADPQIDAVETVYGVGYRFSEQWTSRPSSSRASSSQHSANE